MKTQTTFFLTCFLLSVLVFGQENKAKAQPESSAIQEKPQTGNKKNKKERTRCKARKTQVIIYNFLTGEYETPQLIPCQKVPAVFKIKNINTYFYDVQIQSKDMYINSEDLYDTPLNEKRTGILKIDTTAVLGLLDTKSISTIPVTMKEIKTDNKNQLAVVREKEEKLKAITNNQEKLKSNLSDLELQKKEIERIDMLKKETIELALLPDSLLTNDKRSLLENKETELEVLKEKYKNQSIEDIKNQINAKRAEIDAGSYDALKAENDLKSELAKLQNENDILKKLNEGISELNNQYYTLHGEFTEMLKIAGAYNNYIYKIYRPGMNQTEYQTMKHSDEKFETTAILDYGKISEYYAQIKKFNKTYLQFLGFYYQIMTQNAFLVQNNNEKLAFIKSMLQGEYDRIKNAADEMSQKAEGLDLSTKLNAVEIYNREFQNEHTFEYVSDPIQGMGDYIEFEVTIKPKTQYKEVLVKNQNRKFKYSEYLKGGIRYDFSVGTVFDFLNKDESFENRNGEITKTSQNKYYPTLAGMFHVSFRSNSLCSFGVTMGGSLNIAEFDINSLFLGPSLLVGKKEKIILTAGMSFRKTQQLERGHYEGEYINTSSNINDYMTQNFRLGMFVGLSYNLTKKQKSSLKIGNGEQ